MTSQQLCRKCDVEEIYAGVKTTKQLRGRIVYGWRCARCKVASNMYNYYSKQVRLHDRADLQPEREWACAQLGPVLAKAHRFNLPCGNCGKNTPPEERQFYVPDYRTGPVYGTPDDTTWCSLCHPTHKFGEVLATKEIHWTCPIYGPRKQGACDDCLVVFADDVEGRTIVPKVW
jgi:hypothetical protein